MQPQQCILPGLSFIIVAQICCQLEWQKNESEVVAQMKSWFTEKAEKGQVRLG